MLPDLPNTVFHHFPLPLGEITFLKFMGQRYYESTILSTVICPRTRFRSKVYKCTAYELESKQEAAFMKQHDNGA